MHETSLRQSCGFTCRLWNQWLTPLRTVVGSNLSWNNGIIWSVMNQLVGEGGGFSWVIRLYSVLFRTWRSNRSKTNPSINRIEFEGNPITDLFRCFLTVNNRTTIMHLDITIIVYQWIAPTYTYYANYVMTTNNINPPDAPYQLSSCIL